MASKSQDLIDKYSTTQACFRSQPWRLKTADSNADLYIHEDLLKKSSPALYSVCERQWAETQERVYRFDSTVSEQVVSCFLSYAYFGDYASRFRDSGFVRAPTVEEKDSKSEIVKSGSADQTGRGNGKDEKAQPAFPQAEAVHPLLLHIQLYAFADAYIMPDLLKLSRQKIREYLQKLSSLNTESIREMVLDLIEYAFDNLGEEDLMLTFLSLYASNKLKDLRLSSQRMESLMLGSEGKFVRHLLPKITGSSEGVFSFNDEDLASCALREGFHNPKN